MCEINGIPDNFIIPVSDNQAYRQFGNAVVPPVIEAIGKEVSLSLDSPNIIPETLPKNTQRVIQLELNLSFLEK